MGIYGPLILIDFVQNFQMRKQINLGLWIKIHQDFKQQFWCMIILCSISHIFKECILWQHFRVWDTQTAQITCSSNFKGTVLKFFVKGAQWRHFWIFVCWKFYFPVQCWCYPSKMKLVLGNNFNPSHAAIKISINATAAEFICKNIFPTPVQIKKNYKK